MFDSTLMLVAAAFLLAGSVKGVIGLGLPTIGMGLLALAIPPAQAAAVLIVPSIVTNIVQAAGPGLCSLLVRLWPLLIGVVAGTLAGAGWLDGEGAKTGRLVLGIALIAYAAIGLARWRMVVPPTREKVIGLIVGVFTGLITAATGVFVIPAVPYMQGLGLAKDELVQALGIAFLVSTLALAFNVALIVTPGPQLVIASGVALVAALVGLEIGRRVRGRLDPEAFRRWFFVGLGAIGFWLIARALT
jgi:uncharacterized membrane protein YfcA